MTDSLEHILACQICLEYFEETGDHVPRLLPCTDTLCERSGADPGFPVGGGADPLGGAPTYDFVKFSEKLHEIEKILGHKGVRAGSAPLNPPLEMSETTDQTLKKRQFYGMSRMQGNT